MSDGGFLDSIGVHVPEIVSGFSGGLVKAIFARSRPAEIVAATIGGALTSNYLSMTFAQTAGNLIGREPMNTGVSGFIVGLTAMTICEWILAKVRNRLEAKGVDPK